MHIIARIPWAVKPPGAACPHRAKDRGLPMLRLYPSGTCLECTLKHLATRSSSSDTLGRQAAWRSLPPPGEGSGSPDASPLPEWHVSRVHAQTSSNAFVWLLRGGLRLPAGPSEDSGPELRRRTSDAT